MARSSTAKSWLNSAELHPHKLTTESSLADAVALFQKDTDLRLLPIVDRSERPVGAIFEKDVRRLLLNPFGHALLQNPTIGAEIGSHIRACPIHEFTDDVAVLIDHYRRADGREGMILTRNQRLYAILSNRRLLLLGAEREQRDSEERLKRADRISRAGSSFEVNAASIATQMVQLSDAVQRLAVATVDRSTVAGNQAASVASAAVQSRDSMAVVASRGRSLARAFSDIEFALTSSRTTAQETVERVSVGAQRARHLLDAAQSIDTVMNLVNEIAGTVNLLSLNAAIEAARAGEAGRGFAVVATEIRELSDQTAEATQRISNEVKALRDGVVAVAGDYALVEKAITEMVGRSTEIDLAIVEEADTTRMIAVSVGEASQATHEIEHSVSAIAQAVRSAGSSAHELDSLASELRHSAVALDGEVAEFLKKVRAA